MRLALAEQRQRKAARSKCAMKVNSQHLMQRLNAARDLARQHEAEVDRLVKELAERDTALGTINMDESEQNVRRKKEKKNSIF